MDEGAKQKLAEWMDQDAGDEDPNWSWEIVRSYSEFENYEVVVLSKSKDPEYSTVDLELSFINLFKIGGEWEVNQIDTRSIGTYKL